MVQGTYNQNPPSLVDGQNTALQLDSTGRLKTSADAAALANGTDRSGVAGTTASNLAPANAARRGLNIQNTSNGTLGINEVGGAASIGAAGTYVIPAGGSFNVRTSRAISVIGSAASLSYTATEF